MQLTAVAEASRTLATRRSRKAKVRVLVEWLTALPGDERAIGIPLLCGELRQGKIGIGASTLKKAVPEGAAEVADLSLVEVDQAIDAIASEAGAGSQVRRIERLRALLTRATGAEQSLLCAVLSGGLRQGALEGVMVAALAEAAGLELALVQRALMFAGDLPRVAIAALEEGEAGLEAFRLEHFSPLRPMLAQTAADPSEALASLGRGLFEQKLDGARVQVHRRGSEVRVYSRALNEVTASVPELVEGALALPCESIVLDGEALALDAGGRPRPFQVTMRRFGRRRDVGALRRSLPLAWRYFDCLECDGEELVDRPLAERRDVLARVVPPDQRAEGLETDDRERAERFYAATLDAGHEGLMAKSLQGPYEAGARGAGWFKVKPAHTLDLVVLAAEWGSGRREGWLSNLHLGAVDGDGFAMLGKTFKGLTDELLAWQTEALLALETEREGHVVHVRPELVVEIAFAGVQDSPHYPAGLALRFARVKRYRADKAAREADTLATVRGIRA